MKKLLMIAVLLFATNGFAGPLLEPYLGYGFSKYDQKNTTTEGKVTGPTIGLRLGYSLPIIFFAFDASYTKGKFEPDNSTTKDDSKQSVLGAVLGVSTPLGLRLWGGYNFSDKLVDEASGGDVTYKGKGYKFGLGYKLPLLPISINGEYLFTEYDEFNGMSLTNKVDDKTFLLSVSIPLMF